MILPNIYEYTVNLFLKNKQTEAEKLAEEYSLSNEVLNYLLVANLISLRNAAKEAKDYETADTIRKKLANLGVEIKDTKDFTAFNMV